MRLLNGHSPDPHRRILIKALAAGMFVAGHMRASLAGILGQIPQPLPPNKSIYDLDGTLTVNGVPATPDTLIQANAVLETAPDSRAIFVVGQDAFILREQSKLVLNGTDSIVTGLTLQTGAVLSVFGKSVHTFKTPLASVGIRGTGLYAESMPDQSYICTCYGTTEIAALDNPGETETIVATHHDPRYVLASGAQLIRKAPFKNHTDAELTLIEALVGRVPPFALFDDNYGNPKRY